LSRNPAAGAPFSNRSSLVQIGTRKLSAGPYIRVRLEKTQIEHNRSALTPIATCKRTCISDCSGARRGNTDLSRRRSGTYRAATRSRIMKKTQKKREKASTRHRAPNKRKHEMTARTEVATRPVPMTIAEEPRPRLPFGFWPLEVMKWWMPRATQT